MTNTVKRLATLVWSVNVAAGHPIQRVHRCGPYTAAFVDRLYCSVTMMLHNSIEPIAIVDIRFMAVRILQQLFDELLWYRRSTMDSIARYYFFLEHVSFSISQVMCRGFSLGLALFRLCLPSHFNCSCDSFQDTSARVCRYGFWAGGALL